LEENEREHKYSGFVNFENQLKDLRKEYDQEGLEVQAGVVKSCSTLWDKQARKAKAKKHKVAVSTPKGKTDLLKIKKIDFKEI